MTAPIAIVGLGLVVPGARSPEEFWALRLAGTDLYRSAPADRWEPGAFYSPDPDALDKSYQNRCLVVTDDDPPAAEYSTSWLRHSLRQALDGVAGSQDDHCSLILGYTADGNQHLEEAGVLAATTRLSRQIVADTVPEAERGPLLDGVDRALRRRYWRGLHDPATFLPHGVGRRVAAGLLPATTDVQMIDTACSSSLYAIDLGIKGLQSGRHDVAVCGGAFVQAPRGSVLFSKLHGLSRSGEVRALDESADGVIFADGAAVVVLKTLSRARRDGDRILAVVTAAGTSSDGRGKAIYAPNSAGQDKAVRRALDKQPGGGDPVDWIIAHATGTPAGDEAEFQSLRRLYGAPRPRYVTSNKSIIGHTGWAAGAVSVIEAVLGLRHETIPGQFRFTRAPAAFDLAHTNLQIPTAPVAWPARHDRPRAVAVSGFGFGGTNAHVLVNEFRPEAPQLPLSPTVDDEVVIVGWSAHLPPAAADSFGEFYPAPPFQQVRMPPPTIRATDRCQLMMVQCTHDLRARLGDLWTEHSATTGVFVGNLGPTRSAMLYANRCYFDDIAATLTSEPVVAGSRHLPALLDRLGSGIRASIPASNEDAFPGMMPNIIAARVANYFDLNGPAITVDCGLGSTLEAIRTAAGYLRTGELDLALAGGINGNSLPEFHEVLRQALGPHTAPPAEGVYLFALTTARLAAEYSLPVLAYVNDRAPAAADPGRVVDCGPAEPRRARLLGAAGGLAVLDALRSGPGPLSVTCRDADGDVVPPLALEIAGQTVAGSLPEQFRTSARLPSGEPCAIRRKVPVLAPEPPTTVRPRLPFLPPATVLLTDNPLLAYALPNLPEDLTVLSTTPLPHPRNGWHFLPEVTEQALTAALATVRQPVQHVRILTDLTATAPQSLYERSEPLLKLHDASFLLLKATAAALRTPASSVVLLLLGSSTTTPHPWAGLFTGLAKCVFLELAPCLTFALVVAGRDVAAAVSAAERETAAHRVFPVVHDDNGVRKRSFLRDEDLILPAGTPAVLGRDSVVLAVGGSRGITSEVTLALAEHFRPRIFVVGSNRLTEYPPETFAGTDQEFAAGRKQYIAERMRDRRGRTIGQISKEFDRLIDARTARRNLDTMEAMCGPGRVTYLPCDVRDAEGVREVVDRVLADAGRIDLLIAAAGREQAGLIDNKDFAVFREIRDLKLDGYLNFKSALRDRPPRLWCNFGSVMGHFGQSGETDYSSANDFLSTSAHATTALGRTEFTIGWSAWDDVGIVANDLTKAYFEREWHYTYMRAAEGRHHFVQELHAPVRHPGVVHIGQGERATADRLYPGYLRSEGFFLRRELAEGTFECVLDPATDAYLNHHLVRGVPTLPGTFAVEMAAQAARRLAGDLRVIGLRNVEFASFIKLYAGRATAPYRISARVTGRTGAVTSVEARIVADIVSPGGIRLVSDKLYFSAEVLLAAEHPVAPTWQHQPDGTTTTLTDPYYAASAPVRLTGPFASTVDAKRDARGVSTQYAPDPSLSAEPWTSFVTPAILLDALARTGVLALADSPRAPIAVPLGIDRIDLYTGANDAALLRDRRTITLHVTDDATAVAADPDGSVVAELTGIRLAILGHLDPVQPGAVGR